MTWKQKRTVWRGAIAAFALITALPAPVQAQAGGAGGALSEMQPAHLAGLQDFIDGVMAQQIVSHELAGATLAVVHEGSAAHQDRMIL